VAFSLWLIVNLNLSYNINLQMPIVLSQVNTKQALAKKLPDDVTATVTGRGWDLIKLYKHPPKININVTSGQVNMLQQVRRQIDNQNVTVQKVAPFYLQPKLIPRHTKKVPVKPNVNVQFEKLYGFLQNPVITPDSVTISGGRTEITDIKQWPTDSISLEGVKKNLSLEIFLKKSGPLVQISPKKVSYQAEVAKMTTDEITIPITRKSFPPNRMITFIPSSITIRYEVPLKEYNKLKDTTPFKAVIAYQQIKQDSTGFLKPQIKQTVQNVHLEIRAIQPTEVNYFMVLGDENMTKF
jgi:YbbR domain-containing protein